LQSQIALSEEYKNSINLSVTIPEIVARPNTDIYYLYSENGLINANTSNGGFVFPTGTTEERPSDAIAGTVRYNKDSSSLEIFSTNWQAVGTGAGGSGSGGGAIGGVFYQNSNTITESFTSTAGENIISGGPIILEDPLVSVTIANGSVWTVV
jgi:hypothetical protein